MAIPEFTSRQLDLELALLLRTTHANLCFVIGEERAGPAFGLPEDQQFPEELLPEEFPVEEFPIHQVLQRLAAYTVNQNGAGQHSMLMDLEAMKALTRGLTPELEEFWKGAAAVFPDELATGITPSGDDLDEGFAVGIHYRGLIKSIMALATARWKVDRGHPLMLNEIALLVGFNERSVMSAATRGEFKSEVHDGRRWVDTEEALKWMLPRGYLPTEMPAEEIVAAPEAPAEEMVFVPVAADQTFFSPDCRVGKGYTIGAKGSEQKVVDYFEALHALSQMPIAYWRRANASGNWGIVRGVDWHRVTKSSLDRALENEADQGKLHG